VLKLPIVIKIASPRLLGALSSVGVVFDRNLDTSLCRPFSSQHSPGSALTQVLKFPNLTY
jgi:hypothetical protein